MNNTNTTNSNPFQMGTVNLNTGVSTQAQTTPVTPIQPTNIPNSQNITTFGTQQINLPTQTSVQPAPQLNQAEQILKDTTIAETEAQKASQNLSKAILQVVPSLQGQTQALAEAQNVAGLPAMRQNLQNINNQILQKQAELNQDEIRLAQSVQNIEDKPIAMEFITGQQQSVARNAQIARALKASEIGILNATALGMQGNIALAEATAKQAVETKYAPYKEALDTYKLQLEALQPLLTADEKKQAREQTIKTNLALDEIKQKKEDANKANEMIINAMPFAPQGVTSQALKIVQDGGSIVQVAQALGKYAGDYLGNLVKQTAIAENNAQIRKINAEIKASQTPLPNNALPGSTSSFLTTLANSAVNKSSLESTERESISKNISVLGQLDALEKNLSKETTGKVAGSVQNLFATIGLNPEAGAINAQLQSIIPNLARGVYGEVGVLTDADIENYRKTLPNLTSPKEQNVAVLGMTLQTVKNNLKNKLETAANSGKDVSSFIPQYVGVVQKVDEINDRIGVNDTKVAEIVKNNPQVKPLVEVLIKQGKKGSEILQVLGAD